MTKAIFFDIDGTLLSFKTHSVPQSTIDAINEVKRQGIKVFLATGRLRKQIQNLGGLEFDGFITVNGAYCVTTDHDVIFKKLIPKEELKSLIEYQQNEVKFPLAFMLNEGSFVNYIDSNVEKIANLVKVNVPPVRNLEELIDQEVLQVNLYVDDALEKRIMNEALVSCHASRWHPTFADVNIKGINKSTGIDKFLKHFGIHKSETMAFGDGGNDIEMLRHVAIGIAMGNAGDDVKAAADYVTDDIDNNGVANALRHFGVIK